MSLQVVANQAQLVAAINGFSAAYHGDYFRVRALARAYLAAPPCARTVHPLSIELSNVLVNWGAGRRGAPNLRPVINIQHALMAPNMHAMLSAIAMNPLTSLNLVDGINRTVHGVGGAVALAGFDSNLHGVLSGLSVGIFTNNTNVTYPMKALLLITGFMPALDSQVRGGLGNAGFIGIGRNMTQFKIPANVHCANGKKITRLPFILGECYATNTAIISAAVAASIHAAALAGEAGRIFDVLFFMQKSLPTPLLNLVPGNPTWYNLLP